MLNQQNQLNFDKYDGLADAVQVKAKVKSWNFMILLSTFKGSYRVMMQNYHDEATVVRRIG